MNRSQAVPIATRLALAVVGVAWTALCLVRAQSTPAPASKPAAEPATPGFSFPYRENGQVLFRFSGSSYRGLTEMTVDQFTLETFKTNTGLAEWIVTSPQCVVSTTSRAVHSAGPVLLRQADGLFSLAGNGFQWSHAAQQLVISNHVRATFRLTLFPTLTGGTNSPAP